MTQPLSFTELDIAITAGDVQAFEIAVEEAKSALTDLANGSNPLGVTAPASPLLPAAPAPMIPVKVDTI